MDVRTSPSPALSAWPITCKATSTVLTVELTLEPRVPQLNESLARQPYYVIVTDRIFSLADHKWRTTRRPPLVATGKIDAPTTDARAVWSTLDVKRRFTRSRNRS